MSWYTPADEAHMRRERERARALRKSSWWQSQLAQGVCHYCKGHFSADELTMDHIIPVARGGTSDKSNVVPACFACNQSKAAQTPAEQILETLDFPEDDLEDLYWATQIEGTR